MFLQARSTLPSKCCRESKTSSAKTCPITSFADSIRLQGKNGADVGTEELPSLLPQLDSVIGQLWAETVFLHKEHKSAFHCQISVFCSH